MFFQDKCMEKIYQTGDRSLLRLLRGAWVSFTIYPCEMKSGILLEEKNENIKRTGSHHFLLLAAKFFHVRSAEIAGRARGKDGHEEHRTRRASCFRLEGLRRDGQFLVRSGGGGCGGDE